uniref:Uncharacterized protein n=1 Tax=Salmonella phage vB_SEnST11_KE22 TaxID=3161173 RepID=A0AAU8GE88_9CAUD
MRRCPTGDFVVRYGDWVEVFTEDGAFLISFKATSDMCQDILTRYLVFKAGMDPQTPYRIKRRGK